MNWNEAYEWLLEHEPDPDELLELLDREKAKAALAEAREFRLNDTHYHNTFEPDNCNCMFCKRVAALEQAVSK